MQVPFLGLLLTDVVSHHMHLAWSTLFQATIVSYSAATKAPLPDVNLGTPSRHQLQKPGLKTILLLRISSKVELQAQTSSFNIVELCS